MLKKIRREVRFGESEREIYIGEDEQLDFSRGEGFFLVTLFFVETKFYILSRECVIVKTENFGILRFCLNFTYVEAVCVIFYSHLLIFHDSLN